MNHTRLITLTACLILTAVCIGCNGSIHDNCSNTLRAPSYPLVTIDPYTSAWSPCDELYGGTVEHWTGFPFPLLGTISVDGEDYRFLGKEKPFEYRAVAAGAREHNWEGEYSTDNGRTWIAGKGGFGPEGRKPMTATWIDTGHIKARRTVNAGVETLSKDLYLLCTSKGNAEFKVNGITVCKTSERQELDFYKIPSDALAATKNGRMVLEGDVSSDTPGVFVDLGLYEKKTYQERYPRTAVQTSAQVLPLNTEYTFTCGPVDLSLTFTAPLLPDDLEKLSRPVNYISYSVRSNDGAKHDIALRFEAGREWGEDYAMDESSDSGTTDKNGIRYAWSSCTDQNPLWKSGDGVRIDWGRFLMAADAAGARTEALPGGDVAISFDEGNVSRTEGMLMVGYDDIYSIQYFKENLRPYWNRSGNRSIEDEFEAAAAGYGQIMKECGKFENNLMKTAGKAGGDKYAELCALAWRQAISAHKLVAAPSGELLWLSKENNSNGSIGTVDVAYPAAPLFLLYNNELAKGLLNPIFHYSESGRWTKPFPAHDIGRYPLANGQRYGADMPVEEAGNMLILTAAVCTVDGNASYAEKHWDVLTRWTEYLTQFGLDPENQLCTDDFAGRSAHNVNLSVKAILGIASYGKMAQMAGKTEIAEEYIAKARGMAEEWCRMADDGDHYRLMFDKPGSWSQKYNLVWDKLLGLDIFPAEVAEKEIRYYLDRQNRYGLPLDSRSAYTKTDWILWTATMAEDREDFEAIVSPVWDFYNETTDRIPMGDWVWSDKPEHVQFKARSVVGGLFIKMLAAQKLNDR